MKKLSRFIEVLILCCSGMGCNSTRTATVTTDATPTMGSVFYVSGVNVGSKLDLVLASLKDKSGSDQHFSEFTGNGVEEDYEDLVPCHISKRGFTHGLPTEPSDLVVILGDSGKVGVISVSGQYQNSLEVDGQRIFGTGSDYREAKHRLRNFLVKDKGSRVYYRDRLGQVLVVDFMSDKVWSFALLSPENFSTRSRNVNGSPSQ